MRVLVPVAVHPVTARRRALVLELPKLLDVGLPARMKRPRPQSLGVLSAYVYGIVSVVKHFSPDVEDYDRATEFEVLGGKLIELSASDWKEKTEAV